MDSNQIDTLLALRLSEEPELVEGTTMPILIECANMTNLMNPDVYVVKFKNCVARNGLGIVNEIITARLAKYFGINVPDFCMIEITDVFTQSVYQNPFISPQILTNLNQNKSALNFGSKYLYSNTELPMVTHNFSEQQLLQAELIFAFDALVYNADRTSMVPNSFFIKKDFVVFDHEKSFNFLIDGNTYPNELNFRVNDNCFLTDHLFKASLKGKEVNFGGFIELLENLDDNIIRNIDENIPYDLLREFKDEIVIIKDYLYFVKNNISNFRINLMRVLT